MRVKKIWAALLVVTAVSVVLVSGASATATTTAAKWYAGTTGSEVTELSGEQAVTLEQFSGGAFMTYVSGTEVTLAYSGVECVGCKISNSPIGGAGTAKIRLTGVTVEQPASCNTAATIESKALTVSADWMEGGSELIKFSPSTGEEGAALLFELTGNSCALKTTVIPKGTFFGLVEFKTGVMSTAQTLEFSTPINTEAGGTLHAGLERAGFVTADLLKAGGKFFGVK